MPAQFALTNRQSATFDRLNETLDRMNESLLKLVGVKKDKEGEPTMTTEPESELANRFSKEKTS